MMALTSCHPGKITWCWCGKWQGILQRVEFNLSCRHPILKYVYQMKSMEVFCRLQLTSTNIIKLTVSPTYLILIVSPTCSSLIPPMMVWVLVFVSLGFCQQVLQEHLNQPWVLIILGLTTPFQLPIFTVAVVVWEVMWSPLLLIKHVR